MAELAISLIVLGGLYLVSNKDDEEKLDKYNNKEGYRNLHNSELKFNTIIDKTYDEHGNNNLNNYNNSNQITDKYFTHNQNIDKPKRFYGLTGNVLDDTNFKHNNMVPFFGAKIKGPNQDKNESNLDYKQGAGSQFITKQEQAPLFAPQENLNYANGAPNMSDFYLSRQNPSQKISNTKPWEEKQVGPGLNMGYTTEPTKSGYNAGSESRDSWLPKSVDQ